MNSVGTVLSSGSHLGGTANGRPTVAIRCMRVMVYYNLHKHCLSLKAMDGERRGCVVMHARGVRLSNVAFRVSQAGRERVLREQAKNVHAGVVGELVDVEPLGDEGQPSTFEAMLASRGLTRQLTYDPYRFTSFVTRDTHEPVSVAAECIVIGKRVFIAPGSM